MKDIAASLALLIIAALLSACQAALSADELIGTGVAQTLEVGGYLTQIAAGEGAESTATPAPTEESPPTETASPQAQSCAAPSGQPSLAEMAFPEGLGALEESEGELLLNEEPVLAYYASDEACQTEIWLSLASAPDWPLMIRSAEGVWQAGAKAWGGQLVVVNTSQQTVQLEISTDLEGFGSQEIEIDSEEISDLSAMPPGTYTLALAYGDYAAECRIQFGNESNYIVSVVEVGVAILEESFEPQNSNDVNMLSSPLCTN